MKESLLAITIDTEWAPIEILEKMHAILSEACVPATFFCTDQPKFHMGRLHECALHPNFENPTEWGAKFQALKKLYPTAKGVRSHCLFSDTRLLNQLVQEGVQYVSNLFVPGQPVAPYRREMGLWEIPIHYMDFVHLCMVDYYPRGFTMETVDYNQRLMVLDFHPIPWYINAQTIRDYELAKPYCQNPAALMGMRKGGRGVQTLFEDVLEAVKKGRWRPVTIAEVVRELEQVPLTLWQWPSLTDSTSSQEMEMIEKK